MKIGFFGTPEVASELLKHLCLNHTVLFAVTNIDKPTGRKKKVCKPPVKACAEDHCLDILQPEDLKDPCVFQDLEQYNADLFIVFAYGHLIPRKIFDMPRYGTINLHPSLLPLYRGAAPVQWSIIDGCTETGVTIQKITEKLDAGDIIAQQKVTITPDMSACDLYDLVIPIGIDLVDQVIDAMKNDSLTPLAQADEHATYCGKITRDGARINWNEEVQVIHNLIRGMNPKPGAWSTFRDSDLKIWKSSIPTDDELPTLAIGQIARLGKKRLLVGCKDAVIEIILLQSIGKKPMDAVGFINGARLAEGEVLV